MTKICCQGKAWVTWLCFTIELIYVMWSCGWLELPNLDVFRGSDMTPIPRGGFHCPPPKKKIGGPPTYAVMLWQTVTKFCMVIKLKRKIFYTQSTMPPACILVEFLASCRLFWWCGAVFNFRYLIYWPLLLNWLTMLLTESLPPFSRKLTLLNISHIFAKPDLLCKKFSWGSTLWLESFGS